MSDLPNRLPKPPIGRFIIPGPDGTPYPAYNEPPITKQHLSALIAVGASSLYRPLRRDPADEGRFVRCEPDCSDAHLDYCAFHGELMPGEKAFVGHTNAEVVALRLAERAANGDHDAQVHLLDRMLGKPKQQNENLNVNVNIDSYLDSLPDPESSNSGYVMDAIVVPVSNDEDWI